MPTKPDPDARLPLLATLGVIALPLLCCGVPIFIAIGGVGLVGSILGSPWVIGAAILIALGVLGWRLRHRRRGAAVDSFDPPDPLAHNDSARHTEGR